MKFFLLMLVGILLGVNLIAQIPNSDFENWTLDGSGNLNPDYWQTPNDQSSGYVPVVQGGGYMSTYGMRVYTPNVAGFNLIGATLLGFPTTQRPSAVSGYYIGTWVSGDSSFINVTLSENGNGVGAGVKYFSTNQATYTGFTIPINYVNANTPDTMFITVSSGATLPSTPGADLTIDQLGFVLSGIEIPLNSALVWFAYGSNDYSFFIDSKEVNDYQIKLYDLSGHEVYGMNEHLEIEKKKFELPGTSLQNGMYILNIVGGSTNYSQKILINH